MYLESKKPMLFLVDSNAETLNTLKNMLLESYDVITHATGKEALDLYDVLGLKIRVVLLNVQLSDMSGLDLLDALKQKSAMTEVIAYSNRDDLDLAVDAMKRGAYDYFLYPIDPKALHHTIQQTLESLDMVKRIEDYAKINFLNRFGAVDRLVQLKLLMKQRQLEGKTVGLDELMQFFASEDDLTPPPTAPATTAEPTETPESDKPTVLVIEDEPRWRRNLEAFLKKDYRVLLAENGEMAKKIVSEEQTIDVILLDIYLPDTTGVVLLSELKKINPNPEVIVVTAYRDLEIAISTLRNGACDYLNKPYSKLDLFTKISRALQKKYLTRFLPEFNKRFIENHVSYRCKMTMLGDLIKQRLQEDKPVLMQDIYVFFPELRAAGIPEDTPIKKNIDDEGLIALIDMMKQQAEAAQK